VVTPLGSQCRTLRLYFKSNESPAGIRVRIFTLRNDLVRELSVRNLGDQYLAEWDGCYQGEIRQGIYVYQIEAGGRAFNGALVIAK